MVLFLTRIGVKLSTASIRFISGHAWGRDIGRAWGPAVGAPLPAASVPGAWLRGVAAARLGFGVNQFAGGCTVYEGRR